eukprot:scaffold10710_cov72-Phaeocystis_antarctica.AAC.1
MLRRRARGCGARPTRRCRIRTGTYASPTTQAARIACTLSQTASGTTGSAGTLRNTSASSRLTIRRPRRRHRRRCRRRPRRRR